MSTPQSLSDRVAKLRQIKKTDGADPIPAAEPIPGDWLQHCQAFPGSYPQSRLWFLHQLEPDLTAYHLPALWRLSGELDLNALRLALADLIERHPTLRTSFRLHGSEVVQLIHPPAPFTLEPEPLCHRNPDAVIEQWLEQERTTPFDLASGRLIRARLLVIEHQHHLLLLNHHHIASDGWSRSVLARDLTELYNARHAGRASELPPLRVYYHDHTAWQRQRLSGDRLQTLKDYWIPQLTGLEPLELPVDHPRPATPSHRGASLTFQITPELLAPFEQLCRLEGATLQMGLLALVALLLHRYSRQDDVAIGVPIWGRNHADLEPLIGFFVNTLP
ncbi:MAG: condensation domain-containing protein, partial [Cyanobium sp.]